MWNNPSIFRFGADCDVSKLYDALRTVAWNHPILSCVPELTAGIMHYLSDAELPIEIAVWDSSVSVESRFREFIALFPISGAPLWRAELLPGDNGGYLFLDFHHLFFDGKSFSIFMEDLFKAYRGESLEKDCFFDLVRRPSTPDRAANHVKITSDSLALLPFKETCKCDDLLYGTKMYDTTLSKKDVSLASNKSGNSLNVFALAAAGMALAECTSRTSVVVNWIFYNRVSKAMQHSLGAFVKFYSVFLEIERKSADEILTDVRNQVDLALSGGMPEYINHDVYGGRDPVLINNLTGIRPDLDSSPFDIQQIDYPYCIKELIEYLDVELFYQGGILCFNIAYGNRGDSEECAALFGNRFRNCLENLIRS